MGFSRNASRLVEKTAIDKCDSKAQPLVSVCVQTYQQADYIGQCLDGILSQVTAFDIEILLGEDGSTDGTREICIEYARQHPDKIRLLLHDRRNVVYIDGLPTGRFNFITNLKRARGKYVAICEGDDYWTDTRKLQKQVDLLDNNTEYAASFHETSIAYGARMSTQNYGAVEKNELTAEDMFSTHALFHTSSFLFRASCLPPSLPEWFTEVVSADMALFSMVSVHGPIRKIPGIMSVYRKHECGITNTRRVMEKLHEDRIKLIEHLDEYHGYRFHDKAIHVIACHERRMMSGDMGERENESWLGRLRFKVGLRTRLRKILDGV